MPEVPGVSGKSSEYDEQDMSDLLVWLIESMMDWSGAETLTVRAEIEWNRTFNRSAVRTTHIKMGHHLGPVKVQVDRAAAAMGAMGALRPMPKSWAAQFKDLSRTKRGRATLEAAGFTVAPKTLARWAKGVQAPSKGNREKISAAAERQHAERVQARAGRFADARRAAVDAFTQAVEYATQGDVRFRHIEDLGFS